MLLDYSPVCTDCSYIMNSNRPNLRVQGQPPDPPTCTRNSSWTTKAAGNKR